MSQTSPQLCPQCGTQFEPGRRFCANCGTPAPEPVAPTALADSYPNPPTTPSNPAYPSYESNSSSPQYPDYSAGQPSYLSDSSTPIPPSPYTQYNTPAPPAPPPPTMPSMPYYSPTPAGAKPRPAWFTPVMVLVAIVVIGGAAAGIWAMTRGNGGGGPTGPGGSNNNYSDTQKLNLTAYYASVQLTFTSLEQKDQFSDDSYTTIYSSSSKKNWVRLNFKEKLDQDAASYGALYSYRSAFTLILPDGQTSTAKGAKDYTGPESGVSRDEWVDFQTSDKVDLTNLKLRLGESNEAQMEFPLKDGADLSKYEPVTKQPNTTFKYAGMDWKITQITQSLYFNGDQAKKDHVFVVVELTASNNTDNYVYLSYNFLRLKAGDTTVAPASGSNLGDLDIMDGHTTDVKGYGIFDVPKTSNSTYTLIFPKGENIEEVDQTISF